MIVESFERIHRSNLIGMGVLPIQLSPDINFNDLHLQGNELVDIKIDLENIKKRNTKKVEINIFDGISNKTIVSITGILRIDTAKEFDYIEKGNILKYVLDELSN